MDTTNPAQTVPITTQPGAARLPEIAGYEVLSLVGRGGMGRVYRAKHLALGRIVALKLLAREPDENLLARFREEARAVAKLQHPNIAQLFETGMADDQPFFTQEFLEGGSLAQSFARKPQDPLAAAQVVETIARAIQHSHEHNILHRDLKPANILLAADGTPKVTDFGLAKTFATPGRDTETPASPALTQTGEIVGTPAYMPPEQASGVLSAIGPPSDVYGLGAILYEALTGRPPFMAPDVIRTVMLVREMEPISPRTLQPDVPRDLETICLKCLAKEPHKRYPSAGELADDLKRFRNREPILARPVGAWERTAKWARRKPWQAAVVVLGAALVVGLAVGLGLVADKNRQIRDANGQLSTANAELESTNASLAATLRREEQANTDLRAAKNKVEAEIARAERTLGLTLYALDRYFFVFSDQLKELPKGEKLRLQVLDNARGTLDQLNKFQPDDATLQHFRLEGYDRLGNIEAQMGNALAAESDYAKARDIATTLETRFPKEIEHRRNRLLMIAKIAASQRRRGDEKTADALLDSVLPQVTALATAHSENVSVLDLERVVRVQLVEREMRQGRWDVVETRMREMCDLNRRIAKADKDNPARQLAVIDGERRLAVLLLDLEKVDSAGDVLSEVSRATTALHEPLTIEARRLRANVAGTLGGYLQRRGVFFPAFITYVAALREYDSLAKEFPDSPIYQFQQADTLRYLAVLVAPVEEPAAVKLLEQSEKLLARLVRDYPTDTSYRALHERVAGLLKQVKPPKD